MKAGILRGGDAGEHPVFVLDQVGVERSDALHLRSADLEAHLAGGIHLRILLADDVGRTGFPVIGERGSGGRRLLRPGRLRDSRENHQGCAHEPGTHNNLRKESSR